MQWGTAMVWVSKVCVESGRGLWLFIPVWVAFWSELLCDPWLPAWSLNMWFRELCACRPFCWPSAAFSLGSQRSQRRPRVRAASAGGRVGLTWWCLTVLGLVRLSAARPVETPLGMRSLCLCEAEHEIAHLQSHHDVTCILPTLFAAGAKASLKKVCKREAAKAVYKVGNSLECVSSCFGIDMGLYALEFHFSSICFFGHPQNAHVLGIGRDALTNCLWSPVCSICFLGHPENAEATAGTCHNDAGKKEKQMIPHVLATACFFEILQKAKTSMKGCAKTANPVHGATTGSRSKSQMRQLFDFLGLQKKQIGHS